MEHQNALLSMIRRYLAGELNWSDFERQFYHYYIDELPGEGGMSEAERRFFGGIHEKVDWTTVAPSPQDRRDGWSDEQEFREWLQHELELYLNTHG